eukprot:m51a1_g9627 putative cleavage and polyadenylation specificity factor subunit 1 (1421) ;mRNA; r:1125180-1130926
MSQAYLQSFLPPSEVTSCACGHFTGPSDLCLAVARSTLLQLFAIDRIEGSAKLRLVREVKVHGCIEELGTLRLAGHSRDCLVSVLEYDPGTGDFEVVSLHRFERDELKVAGYERPVRGPWLRTDPLQHCAALLVRDRTLAIVSCRPELDAASSGPLAPSYAVPLRDLGVDNVVDMAFLHRYYEPTLAVLFQPRQTWSGRLPYAKDTCTVAVYSLDTASRKHPVLWSAERLPFSCCQVFPVPAAFGGVLVLSPNVVFYCNQNYRYALTLNEFGEEHMQGCTNAVIERSEVTFVLENPKATALSPERVLLSTHIGDIFVLHLLHDGRAFHSMQITRAKTGPLASCMCTLPDTDLIFIGSRLGDSILVKYAEKHDAAEDDEGAERPEKRRRVDEEGAAGSSASAEGAASAASSGGSGSGSGGAATGMGDADIEDESLFYGQARPRGQQRGDDLVSYKFSVEDHLSCSAPIRDIAIGESFDPASLSGREPGDKEKWEAVACCGSGKTGSLQVFQSGVRPDVLPPVWELPGCECMWTLMLPPTQAEPNPAGYHAFLVISKPDRTMVLSTREELAEVTQNVEFVVDRPTLNAANVLGLTRVAQVTAAGVALMDNVKRVCDWESPQPVVSSAIADKYISLVHADGSLSVLSVQPPGSIAPVKRLFDVRGPSAQQTTAAQLTPGAQGPPSAATTIVACALFESSWLPASAQAAAAQEPKRELTAEEQEFEELYASAQPDGGGAGAQQQQQQQGGQPEQAVFCATVSHGGVLRVLHVPSCEVVFESAAFAYGPRVVFHGQQQQRTAVAPPRIVELAIRQLSARPLSPTYLIALHDSGDFYVYRFLAAELAAGALPVRMQRIEHGYIGRDIVRCPAGTSFVPVPQAQAQQPQVPLPARFPRMAPFADAAGHAGVFVCGKHPAFVLDDRGYARAVPMTREGAVTCFTALHNVKCPHGFIFCNDRAKFKICQMPAYMAFDGPWPVKKVALRKTPHRLAYHAEARVYVAALSTRAPINYADLIPPAPTGPYGEQRQNNPPPPPPPPIPIIGDKYELVVLAPGTWAQTSSVELADNEAVTSIKVVNMIVSQQDRATRPFVVVATTLALTEDITSKGRIILYDVDRDPGAEQQPQQGGSGGCARLREVCVKEQKGAVSALASLEGYICVAVGTHVFVMSFADAKDLNTIAIYDAQIHVSTLSTAKNWVLMGDAYKSVHFLRWREDTGRNLTLQSKDYRQLPVLAGEFLIHNQNLGLVVADANRNMQILAYAPQSLESRKGHMLLYKADAHVGSLVTKFLRVSLLDTSGGAAAKGATAQQQHQRMTACLFGTSDGAFCFLRPLDERVFRVLLALQARMAVAVPMPAGLNPMEFRAYKSPLPMARGREGNIVDGDLLARFLSLPVDEAEAIARHLGVNSNTVINTLLDIHLSANYFK